MTARRSLGQAERSSDRRRQSRCSNSSAAAAKSGAPRVCAMPAQAAVERLNATAVQIMLASQGDAGPPGRRRPVGEADLVPADRTLTEQRARWVKTPFWRTGRVPRRAGRDALTFSRGIGARTSWLLVSGSSRGPPCCGRRRDGCFAQETAASPASNALLVLGDCDSAPSLLDRPIPSKRSHVLRRHGTYRGSPRPRSPRYCLARRSGHLIAPAHTRAAPTRPLRQSWVRRPVPLGEGELSVRPGASLHSGQTRASTSEGAASSVVAARAH